MNSDYPSTDGHGGESTRAVDDERCLYGEPCHERSERTDEKALYGKPQHESSVDADDTRDIELLFVRMQNDVVGPRTLGSTESHAQTSD